MSATNETPQPEEHPPGYDTAAVTAWIEANVEGLTPPLVWVKCEGGHSNITYELTDSVGNKAVIRRPPEGVLLPKAHDMEREYRIIEALDPTAVPVAKPLGFCESPDVTGAHFYVMGFVDGNAMYDVTDVEAHVPLELRPTMAHSFVDVLAALHALDPDEIGLGHLGRKESYVARQISRWYGSWNASIEAAEIDTPEIHAMHDKLMAQIPEQGPARVVHGDYGTHNSLIGADGHIAAVVDWEISTLGDPMADLAYFLNMWVEPTDPTLYNLDAPTLAPGFPSRAELAARYAELTGADLTLLPFYEAFNRFKSACIIHGVYARYMNGQKEITAEDLADVQGRVHRSIELAITASANLD